MNLESLPGVLSSTRNGSSIVLSENGESEGDLQRADGGGRNRGTRFACVRLFLQAFAIARATFATAKCQNRVGPNKSEGKRKIFVTNCHQKYRLPVRREFQRVFGTELFGTALARAPEWRAGRWRFIALFVVLRAAADLLLSYCPPSMIRLLPPGHRRGYRPI